MERPAWIEPTSPDPVVAASVGDRVQFRSGGVEGSAPFACKDAQYTQLGLKSSEYFGGGIPDPAVARDAADRYGLGDSAETLRVDCDAGVFDYHEGSGNLVVEFDNMVYTLKRTTPR